MRKDTIERRKRILNAAIECYKDVGVQFSSLGMVADVAGVTRPTVYAHFSSKENLFSEVMNIVEEQYAAQPLPKYENGECPKKQIFDFFRAYIENVTNDENMKLYRALVMEALRKKELAPEYEELSNLSQLIIWLNDAKSDGKIIDIDTGIAASNLVALMDGLIFWPILNCVKEFDHNDIEDVLENGLGSYVDHLFK
ncbi:TetR/AcrR family transcriptional regulator [Pseudemcibacter aquimaris]|uniref:TetR/AcrR family transcriptional regulator n=1 Tax=Pseudemcibacter aquimaris TaxID=2857064 RepID=UPI0020136EC8|nr:TetR/AcrR family transcriptional regulator [Pseudemcibacter aquimaris]MCC3860243.1 TetR/AcrR family transcriptional regulator [Pseudemcibacter aquimaris]WDU57568.1 TetR/AcrR family transcriptional regulator [Pseudemcibacter aquimaris]